MLKKKVNYCITEPSEHIWTCWTYHYLYDIAWVFGISPLHDYCNTKPHTTTIDNLRIVHGEGQQLARTIKDSIYTMVNSPSLNKNIGKYHLPHIWDEVLSNTSELKITSPFAVSGYSICHLSLTSANMLHHNVAYIYHSACSICHL